MEEPACMEQQSRHREFLEVSSLHAQRTTNVRGRSAEVEWERVWPCQKTGQGTGGWAAVSAER